MSNFILIFLCLGLGVLLKRTRKLPEKSHQVLNAMVIHVSLPAMVLLQISTLLRSTDISPGMIVPISMAWILFILSFLFFSWLGKRLRWPRAEYGALILTAGLGNTSFVGFPLLESLFGPTAIQIGVLVDQLGTFLVLSTLGLVTASALSPFEGKSIHLKSIVKSVFTFPPFLSVIGAVVWFLSGTSDSPVIGSVLERLASTLVPLALVAVGFQLKVNPSVLKRHGKPLLAGLTFKLFIAPVFFYLLYVVVFQSKGYPTQVTLVESAMAPMITAAVVAEEFGFNAEISSLMVGVGIPVSIATVCLWHQIFGWILLTA